MSFVVFGLQVRKRAQRMFKEIDADKSGHLDRGEILELAKAMDADPDGDGGAIFYRVCRAMLC